MKLQHLFRRKRKIGLCLSGGGLRGIAHIGVLKAIEEKGIEIAAISGTSAGAIIGALHAHGYSSDTMLHMLEESSFFSRKSFRLLTSGIFSNTFLLDLFKRHLPEDNFSSLTKPLHVAAVDINAGAAVYFSQGALHLPLLASASIPFVLPTVAIKGHLFCDGGVLNNLPIEPLLQRKMKIIASHVNSVSKLNTEEMQKLSSRALLNRVFHLGMSNHVYLKRAHCDVFIEPPNLVRYSLFDKKNMKVLYDLGYKYAAEALKAFE